MTPTSDNEGPKRPARGTAARGRTQTERDRRPKQAAQETSAGERGVLSNLPSTRPQRPSARRAAAKRAAAKRSGPTSGTAPTAAKPADFGRAPADTTPPKRRATVKRAPAKHRAAPPPPVPPVPPQGFETENEIEPGTPVQPPSRPEVAGALAELVGELAQTGLSRGGRLVREALGRLPGI